MQYEQCYTCRRLITEEDKQSADYVHGESCPHCVGIISEKQKCRFHERERQIQLEKQRGKEHIGSEVQTFIQAHREEKQRKRERARLKAEQRA